MIELTTRTAALGTAELLRRYRFYRRLDDQLHRTSRALSAPRTRRPAQAAALSADPVSDGKRVLVPRTRELPFPAPAAISAFQAHRR